MSAGIMAAQAPSAPETALASSWVQDTRASTDTWNRDRNNLETYGHIAQYAHRGDYCWQAVRNGARLSGIQPTREEAIAAADAHLAMPIEAFNAIVADGLKRELLEIERKLLAVLPKASLLPGYHAGYEAGFDACKARIMEALQ